MAARAAAIPGAAVLGLLFACTHGARERDRSELRDAILLEDGNTAVVAFSSRQVRQVRQVGVGLLPGGGIREETLRHWTVLGRFDLATGAVTRLAAFDLGPGHDHSHLQLLWSLGNFVLLHGPFPTKAGVQSDHALLDASTGTLERLDLEQFVEQNGLGSVVDVRLVSADGTLAVTAGEQPPRARRGVWLRRATGAFEQLCADGRLDGCSREEVAYHETGAGGRIAYRLADGRRRPLHPREYGAAFSSAHQNRPVLLQVRGLPGRGGRVPGSGPFLALARREGDRWVENELPIDVGPLR
ncbi:MAG: hypothetical protein IPK26_22570 [Planctomycetes bacterium]|nr:hypothetical protein [Planctomycetota bacterium]